MFPPHNDPSRTTTT